MVTGFESPEYQQRRAEFLRKLDAPPEPYTDEELAALKERLPLIADLAIGRLLATIDALKAERSS